uniref:Nudix hydrolase domain-containing protein n=1 Tax=Steinernema glaseri TaxID=37863 RepID=A0A1I7Y1X4_9BILA
MDVDAEVRLLKEIFEPFAVDANGSVPDGRVAAVLVLLHKTEDAWSVLLTVRSQHLRRHPGEVCFPGGMKEDDDENVVRTALRESLEEVGLPEDFVRVVTTLKPMRNRGGIVIYPVVSVLARPFQPCSSSEVDRCFWVPLEEFLSAENHSSMYFHSNVEVHSFAVHGTNVFGFTSFVCVLIAAIVFNRVPQFPVAIFANTELSPREAIANALVFGIHGYSAMVQQNKL